jgi:murein DD-endopeptidase MepM/ murein hydrolase activator NlpD
MVKYFLKVLFTILFLHFLSRIAFGNVTLLTPPNGAFFEDNIIDFSWTNTDPTEDYIYKHYLYTGEDLVGGAITRVLEENKLTKGVASYKIYLWRVMYHPKDSFNGDFEYETDPFIFSVNKEIPEEMLEKYLKEDNEEDTEQEEQTENSEEFEEEKKKEKEEQEEVEDKMEQESPKKKERVAENETQQEDQSREKILEAEVLGDSTVKDQTSQPNVFARISQIPTNQESRLEWNTVKKDSEENSKKANSSNNVVCRFKYFKKKDTLEKIYCNIPHIKFLEEVKYPFSNEYSIFIKGTVVRDFKVQVDEYVCTFNLTKPSTWFRCEEKFIRTKILDLKPNIRFGLYRKNKKIPIKSFFLENNVFRLSGGYVPDTEEIRLVQRYRMVHREYNLFQNESREYALKVKENGEWENDEALTTISTNSSRPFIFPFNKIIGVTQWYGNTVYQTPHTGIDFGATKEKVLAVSSGEVVGKGWDSHYGECLSGGNYLRVKQDNDMYTVYFHLEDILVNTGDFVKEGDTIAISGNTGAWNCQPLAYHLHFETRLNASSSSHRNPVKYIGVDWNKVPTLGYQKYPGRLSGENPHPGW